jgi:putative flippase GtrA
MMRIELNGLFLRLVRYGMVGIVISIAYSLCVMFFVSTAVVHSATWASVAAFIIILPIAYAGHRRITFFDVASDSFQPLRFVVSAIFGFFISTGGMYVATNVFARSYLFGIALNWALIPAVNFAVYLIWVFRVGRCSKPMTSNLATCYPVQTKDREQGQ